MSVFKPSPYLAAIGALTLGAAVGLQSISVPFSVIEANGGLAVQQRAPRRSQNERIGLSQGTLSTVLRDVSIAGGAPGETQVLEQQVRQITDLSEAATLSRIDLPADPTNQRADEDREAFTSGTTFTDQGDSVQAASIEQPTYESQPTEHLGASEGSSPIQDQTQPSGSVSAEEQMGEEAVVIDQTFLDAIQGILDFFNSFQTIDEAGNVDFVTTDLSGGDEA